MGLILNIDCSSAFLYISIAKNGIMLCEKEEKVDRNHAASIHIFIQKLLHEQQLQLQAIDAVAVMNGPGSYTGLRIGLATAKGICFTLNKPLILISNLEALAYQYLQENTTPHSIIIPFFEPMLGELIYCKYNQQLQIVEPAKHINFNELEPILDSIWVGLFEKNVLENSSKYIYKKQLLNNKMINSLSFNHFINKYFYNIVTSEPFYLKSLYINVKK